jgi:hypothetical protein
MRSNSKTRALLVVAAGTIAALTAGVLAGSQAFGVTHGRRFASSPSQARFGHGPNTLNNRSISQCPAGAHTVQVQLMQGTTTLASASTTADAKGKWAVTMSIPTNLKPGTYAVTATCSNSGTVALSYKPQNFKVTPAVCPSGTTTSTTVKCRVPSTTTSSI